MKLTKETIIVKPNMEGFKAVNDFIDSFLKQGKPVTVDLTEGERKKRGLSANALQHVWIAEIAEFQGDSVEQVECELKRDIGLPIYLGDATENAVILGYMLEQANYYSMTEEQKLKVMKVTPVTSLMTTKQHNRYRKEIQLKYAKHGLVLEVR